MREELRKALIGMVENGASDLHITANSPMHYRIDDELVDLDDKVLTSQETKDIIYSFMDEDAIKRLENDKESEFSLALEDILA